MWLLCRVCCQLWGQRTQLVLSRRAWPRTCLWRAGSLLDRLVRSGSIARSTAKARCPPFLHCLASYSWAIRQSSSGCTTQLWSRGAAPPTGCYSKMAHARSADRPTGLACRSTRRLAGVPEPRCKRASQKVWLLQLVHTAPFTAASQRQLLCRRERVPHRALQGGAGSEARRLPPAVSRWPSSPG